MKPTSNAPAMSSCKSDSQSSSSRSEVSETNQSEKNELIIPSPALMTNVEDGAVIPSQHKMAMMKKMADKSDISDSNSDSEGEKDDEEGKDDQSKPMVEQMSSVFSEFTK